MSPRDEVEPVDSSRPRPSGEVVSRFADVQFSNRTRSSHLPGLAVLISALVSAVSAVIAVVAMVYSLRLPPSPAPLVPISSGSKGDPSDKFAPLVEKLSTKIGELAIALKDAHVPPRGGNLPESHPPTGKDGDPVPANSAGSASSETTTPSAPPAEGSPAPAEGMTRDDASKAIGRLAGRLDALQASNSEAFAHQANRIDRLVEVFGQAGDLATPRDLAVIAFNSKSLPFASYQDAYEDVFIDRPLQQRYKGQRVGLWVAVTQELQEIIPLTWQESKLEEYRSKIRSTATGKQTTDRPDEIVGKLAQNVFDGTPTKQDLTTQKPILRRCVFVVAADCRAPNPSTMAKGDPEIDVILIDSGNVKVEELQRWVEFSASRNGLLLLIRPVPIPAGNSASGTGGIGTGSTVKPLSGATTSAEVTRLKPDPSSPTAAASAEATSPHPRLVEPLKKELRRLTQPLLERR